MNKTGGAGYRDTTRGVESAERPESAVEKRGAPAGETSLATQLTAELDGLKLSAKIPPTTEQLLRLFDDTRDKYRPSVANYDPDTGYGSTVEGERNNNYGRRNEHEFTDVVNRGGKDVFLRDNHLDWGNISAVKKENGWWSRQSHPTSRPVGELGSIDFWESPDIMVTTSGEPDPTNSFDFDKPPLEAIGYNAPHRVHVRVRNRGYAKAQTVHVRVFWAQAGALPALPEKWWDWHPFEDQDRWHSLEPEVVTLENLPNSGSTAAKIARDFPRDATRDLVGIAHFDFDEPTFTPGLPNKYCLLAFIQSETDPISAESRGKTDPAEIVKYDNNVAHRNFDLTMPGRRARPCCQTFLENLPGPRRPPLGFDVLPLDERFPFLSRFARQPIDATLVVPEQLFFVRNPRDEPIQVVLRLQAPANWTVRLDRFGFNRPFELEPDEEILVRLNTVVPERRGEFHGTRCRCCRKHRRVPELTARFRGEVKVIQERVDVDPPVVMGGMTYRLQNPAACR